MAKLRVEITPRDLKVFMFIWKWKVAPTALIWRRYFPGVKPFRCYQRLCELMHAGYLDRHDERSGDIWLWTLSRQGFDLIRSSLPALKEDGFKSESPVHDLYVLAVQLGDWALGGKPDGIINLTEQQLRRYDASNFPAKVPRYFSRRPDGYWLIESESRNLTLALEVEISRKSEQEYKDIAHAYSYEKLVDVVFWFVPSASRAEWLHEILNEAGASARAIHNFLLLPDFDKNGWQAKIIIGRLAGKSLAELMHSQGLKQGENTAKTFSAQQILDARRTPFSSNGYYKAPSRSL